MLSDTIHRTTFGSSTNTSLPPLQDYRNPASGYRRPWGEETLQLGTDPHPPTGYARFRHNFNLCHPIREEVKRCDEYRFPKALRVDVGVFPGANVCMGRHFSRSPTSLVFPINNQDRIDKDGQPILGKSTRETLAEYDQKLYCTSRYDEMYRDTSNNMIAKLERDAQYHHESILYNETPTCCRILNHPDPCHMCWAGGLNDHKHVTVPTNGKPCSYHYDYSAPCQQCELVTCLHKNHCLQPKVFTQLQNIMQKIPPIQIGNRQNDGKMENHQKEVATANPYEGKLNSNVQEVAVTDKTTGNTLVNSSKEAIQPIAQQSPIEDIGPWPYDHRLQESEEQMLLENVYHFKLPSALHCKHTQNEHMFNFPCRHNPYNYYMTPMPTSTLPWASMCRCEHTSTPEPNFFSETLGKGEAMSHYKSSLKPIYDTAAPLSTCMPNRWTFRDKNNLRVPCISDVIGSWQKSAAQKRYHQAHSEPIPDLRDNLKYSKRVSFYGYNSSVYR